MKLIIQSIYTGINAIITKTYNRKHGVRTTDRQDVINLTLTTVALGKDLHKYDISYERNIYNDIINDDRISVTVSSNGSRMQKASIKADAVIYKKGTNDIVAVFMFKAPTESIQKNVATYRRGVVGEIADLVGNDYIRENNIPIYFINAIPDKCLNGGEVKDINGLYYDCGEYLKMVNWEVNASTIDIIYSVNDNFFDIAKAHKNDIFTQNDVSDIIDHIHIINQKALDNIPTVLNKVAKAL
jgi:hypothetical protein